MGRAGDGTLILGLDTSGYSSHVAVLQDGMVLGEASKVGIKAAESTLVLVDEVLRVSNVSLEELGTIAVAIGPGSYTGIRSGIAMAIGFSLGSGVELVGVSVMLAGLMPKIRGEGRYLTVLEANVHEQYVSMFDVRGNFADAAGAVIEESIEGSIVFVVRKDQFSEMMAKERERATVTVVEVGSVEAGVNPGALVGMAAGWDTATPSHRMLGRLKPLYGKAVQARTLAEREGEKKANSCAI